MKVATRFISLSEKEQSSLKQLNQRHPLNKANLDLQKKGNKKYKLIEIYKEE